MQIQEEVQNIIMKYCNWGLVNKLRMELNTQPCEIDILYHEGLYFILAIDRNYPEILSVLLDYYEKTKLKGDPETAEYKLNRAKLQEILRDEVEGSKFSDEIMELLRPYIGDIDGEDTDYDLSEFGDEMNPRDLSWESNLVEDFNSKELIGQTETPHNSVFAGENMNPTQIPGH